MSDSSARVRLPVVIFALAYRKSLQMCGPSDTRSRTPAQRNYLCRCASVTGPYM